MFRTSSSLLRSPAGAFRIGSRLSRVQLAPRVRSNRIPAPTTQTIRLNSNSSRPPTSQPIDKEHERKIGQQKLEPQPDVSSSSSTRRVLETSTSQSLDHPGIDKGLQHDIGIVKDSFRLNTVPRESHILGLAGTVPYLATSLSTVFLAWDLTKDIPSGNTLYDIVLVNHDTARYLLDVIEPLQIGYGAVIISFLGAIHWGLEYAEKAPQRDRTRFRYGIGLAASVIAWPTLLMPIEYALFTQFGAFVALYYVDAQATTRGWAPHWYSKYRFLLTAMVGLAIFISLIGRTKLSQHGALSEQSLHSKLTDPGIADKSTDWAKLEEEERERIKKEEAEEAKKDTEEKKKRRSRKIDGKEAKGHSDQGTDKQNEKDRNSKDKNKPDDEKASVGNGKEDESPENDRKQGDKGEDDEGKGSGKSKGKENGETKAKDDGDIKKKQ